MPSSSLLVRWPDAAECRYRSPSACIHRHLPAGMKLPVGDFLGLSHRAFREAAERVTAANGFARGEALAALEALEADAQTHPDGNVEVLPAH